MKRAKRNEYTDSKKRESNNPYKQSLDIISQNIESINNKSHTKDTKTIKKIPYLALLSLSFAVFVFNTSEFIPIGLLSLIANDFGMSDAHTGIMITIYAWVVALVSLPLMLLLSNIALKRLMLFTIAIFVLSHIASALSQNYYTLIASRIAVACAHAIFWSIASPMAVRIVQPNKQGLALSFIITGGAIAIILGLPLGRVIGLYIGWRMSFLAIGILAFLTLIMLWQAFPKLESTDSISLAILPKIFKNKSLMAIYLITAALITAHFTAYSYIEPFLAKVAHFSEDGITLTLVAFGLVGVVGSAIFARFYEGRAKLFVGFAIFGVCICLFMLNFGAISAYAMIMVCLIWGLSMNFFNLAFQSQIIALCPKGTAIAMSIFSGIYNVGIGGGAAIGGLVIDSLNIGYIGYIGGIIAVFVCGFYMRNILWTLSVKSR